MFLKDLGAFMAAGIGIASAGSNNLSLSVASRIKYKTSSNFYVSSSSGRGVAEVSVRYNDGHIRWSGLRGM